MKDVMLDLETMSTDPRAVIVSVGACYFGPGGIGERFYAVLDMDEQQHAGRHVSDQTVKWWSQQSASARLVLEAPYHPVATVLDQFKTFMGRENVRVWGNGSDFDCVVFGTLFDDFKFKRPWSYSNHRCYRTLKNIMTPLEPMPGRLGTHHNALDDAEHQARCAAIYMRGKTRWD